MEAYAGGRQRTHQDNFDDLDLERRPEKKVTIRSQLADDEDDDTELDGDGPAAPLSQRKPSGAIKINLSAKPRPAPPPVVPIPFPSQAPKPVPVAIPLPIPFPAAAPPSPTAPKASAEDDQKQKKNQQKKEDKARQQQELQKLLATEIFLDSESYRGLLFQRVGMKKQHYTCRVCQVQVLDKDIPNHSKGRRHMLGMLEAQVIDYKKEQQTSPPKQQPQKPTLFRPSEARIEPGQPVPPGFEDSVRTVPLCKTMLDAFTDAPLIGLEYLVELMAPNDGECHVVCFLCDRRGESLMQNVRQNIVSHMIGTTHRLNYLKRHFGRAHEALARVQADKALRPELSRLVRGVVASIETAYGRLDPMLVDGSGFRNRCSEYRDRVERSAHFSEAPGRTFEECAQLERPRRASVESLELSPEPQRRRLCSRSRSPWSPERERRSSPFRRRGLAYRSYRNQSLSPKGDTGRISPIFERKREENGRRSHPQNATPTLDEEEESGLEIIEIPVAPKNKARNMPLADALRLTTPISDEEATPIRRRQPLPERGERGRRRRRSRSRSISFSPVSSGGSVGPETGRVLSARERVERFRHEAASLERELRRQWRRFDAQPERHPEYNNEWRKFWSRKQAEVRNEGGDPARYDYTPEWKLHWAERVEQIQETELRRKRRRLKRRLGLVADNSEEEEDGGDDRGSSSVSEVQNAWRALTGSDLNQPASRTTPPKQPAQKSPPPRPRSPKKPPAPTLLNVLRRLRSLSGSLAGLAAGVDRLLGRAMALEGAEEGSSAQLLRHVDATVLLEAVNERLRGLLAAGIVDRNDVATTRDSVGDMSLLLASAPTPLMRERIQEAEKGPEDAAADDNEEPLEVAGIGRIGRKALALRLAEALLAQGAGADVAEVQLIRLVDAVLGGEDSTPKPPEPKPVVVVDSGAADAEAEAALERLAAVSAPAVPAPADMSDDDLISCLKIFEFLPEHEKLSLIEQLQRLERTEPERVKRLRRFVNASATDGGADGGAAPLDDEDDYADADVMLAARKNLEPVASTNLPLPEIGAAPAPLFPVVHQQQPAQQTFPYQNMNSFYGSW